MLGRVVFVPLLMLATCSQNGSPPADVIAVAAPAPPVLVDNPAKIGECTERTIAAVTDLSDERVSRKPPKRGTIDPGIYVRYTNKDAQVSHEWDAALAHSKVGDHVRMCLIEIPKECPPGDNRGRVYKTTNLRTNEVWTMPDDPHMCGGA